MHSQGISDSFVVWGTFSTCDSTSNATVIVGLCEVRIQLDGSRENVQGLVAAFLAEALPAIAVDGLRIFAELPLTGRRHITAQPSCSKRTWRQWPVCKMEGLDGWQVTNFKTLWVDCYMFVCESHWVMRSLWINILSSTSAWLAAWLSGAQRLAAVNSLDRCVHPSFDCLTIWFNLVSACLLHLFGGFLASIWRISTWNHADFWTKSAKCADFWMFLIHTNTVSISDTIVPRPAVPFLIFHLARVEPKSHLPAEKYKESGDTVCNVAYQHDRAST